MPYTAPPGTPPNAAPDDTLTKRPPPRSAITAHAGRLTLSAPRSCVSITASSCASVSSANGAMRTWPALFTTTSTAPNASSAASTMARPPSGVAIVSRFATASPPAATISATTASAGGSVGASATPSVSLMPTPRSFTSTRAPRAANRSAYSRPRLRPAPVTTTTFPSNRSSVTLCPPFGVVTCATTARLPRQIGRDVTHRCTRACALPSTRRSSRRSCWWSCARRAARCPRGSCASAGSRRRGSPTAAAW